MDAPRLIEFGACAIAASGSSDGGSSLTSAKDDGAGTLFLLPENRTADNANKVAYCEQHNRQNQGGGKLPMTVTMIRDAYRINNIIKGGGRGGSVHQLDARQKQRGHHNRANNDIDPQRQHREQKQKCPQFLPSLNYSSMHEESQKNQVAGLILSDGDDGGDDFPRSPMWGGFGGMQTRASSKRGGSLNRSNNAGNTNNAFRQMDLQEEQENVGAGGNEQRPRRRQQQHQHEMWQKKKKQQQREQPKRNEEEKGGPTYVFSVPSCSFSPSNSSTLDGDDLQYLGVVGGGGMGAGGGTSALVTHRPRGFRKKILNTFRGVNKNKKKFRKSLA